MENHDPIKNITLGQVGKLLELLEPALRKSGLQSEPAQQVLENQGSQVVSEMVAVFRKFVDAVSNIIVRHVAVNRTRSAQEAIAATGRMPYIKDYLLASMNGHGGEKTAEVFFVKPEVSARPQSGLIYYEEVAKYLDSQGFRPADLWEIASVNEADHTFADNFPNASIVKDENGNWSHIAFSRISSKRFMEVDHDDGFNGGWLFAGCRK